MTLPSEIENAIALIDKIDHLMATRTTHDPVPLRALEILDDINASRNDLDMIGMQIGPQLSMRLTAIANSVYLGTLKRGQVGTFYDVVNCLGTERTKALIFMLTDDDSCDDVDPEIEALFAASYATSIMAKIIATQTGFREDDVKKAELCGLYMDIGRKTMIHYRKIYDDDAIHLTKEFIETYHPYLGFRSKNCRPLRPSGLYSKSYSGKECNPGRKSYFSSRHCLSGPRYGSEQFCKVRQQTCFEMPGI